jgi:crossover junction endodeoxyribonuclease RuvC
MTTILGVDPGSRVTGFGVVRTDGESVIQVLSFGVIAPPLNLSFHERIGIIASEFEILIERLQPQIAVIERVFLGKNADSAFKLGHARGVVVAAAARTGCGVVEYATRAVKQGITGNGNASKEQVQTVLFAALGISEKTASDASDALALAFFHSRNLEVLCRLKRAEREL